MLVFLDIAATSYDVEGSSILEVGFCVTTNDLEQVGGGYQLVQPMMVHENAMSSVWRDAYRRNGLLDDIAREADRRYKAGEPGIRRYESEQQLVEWFTTFPERFDMKKAVLAGFGVGRLRAYLNAHMPRVSELFGANLDVSSIDVIASHWAPELYATRPNANGNNRAWKNAELALDTTRYYRENGLFQVRP